MDVRDMIMEEASSPVYQINRPSPTEISEIEKTIGDDVSISDAVRKVCGTRDSVIPTPITLRRAFSFGKEIMTEEGYLTQFFIPSNTIGFLIEQTGRFTEYHPSDLVFVISELMEAIKVVETASSIILAVGIRESGVDSVTGVMSTIDFDAPRYGYGADDSYYRKLYGIRVSYIDGRIMIETRDIKDRFLDYYTEDDDFAIRYGNRDRYEWVLQKA